jgi:hypothetical protein
MPRLVRGGKWVYGWVTPSLEKELAVPLQAWIDYGFETGEQAIFLRGSRCSGGFSISTPRLLAGMFGRIRVSDVRMLGHGRFGEGRSVSTPQELSLEPGVRLLAVRGSRSGLGFVAQGPIYQTALLHPELEIFCVEESLN